jgi:hypothetical protein
MNIFIPTDYFKYIIVIIIGLNIHGFAKNVTFLRNKICLAAELWIGSPHYFIKGTLVVFVQIEYDTI